MSFFNITVLITSIQYIYIRVIPTEATIRFS